MALSILRFFAGGSLGDMVTVEMKSSRGSLDVLIWKDEAILSSSLRALSNRNE